MSNELTVRRSLLPIGICFAVSATLFGAEGLKTKPEDVGLSAERLQRIRPAMQRYIDNGDVSGVVTLVARKGRIVYFEAQGLMDIEAKKPMRTDAIFRLASQRKPITAVSILMLLEEGKVYLTDPVSKFIPEFKNQKVGVPVPNPQGGQSFYVVPVGREMVVKDLLTHSSGLNSDQSPAAIDGSKTGRVPEDTLATYMPRLASIPLSYQPGTAFRYSSLGFEVLARIVEVASGMPFDQFLAERIFRPLNMKDTYFYQPEKNRERIAKVYRKTEKGLELAYNPGPTKYYTEAGGLYSTAEDYLQFAQMLLNGGELNGRRLLSRKTVEVMTMAHVNEETFNQGRVNEEGYGFGLSVRVLLDPRKRPGLASKGTYGWSGAYSTTYLADPKEQLIGLFMVQNGGGGLQNMSRDFHHLALQAIID